MRNINAWMKRLTQASMVRITESISFYYRILIKMPWSILATKQILKHKSFLYLRPACLQYATILPVLWLQGQVGSVRDDVILGGSFSRTQ